jgi:type I restriction enzyme S subunit
VKALTPGDRYVPWFGNLFGSWEWKPLKYCIHINSEVLPENTSGHYEFRYIDISCVTSTGYISSPETLTFDTAPSRARRVVRKGDTIVSTVRTYLKAIAFIENDATDLICSTGFAVLRPRVFVLPKFLFYWARSSYFVDEICARSVGVSYPAINALEIGSLPFPMLPIAKQQEIVEFVDRKLTWIDSMMDKALSLVTSAGVNGGILVEYRDALITAAVTGKIDARRGSRTESQVE